MLLDIASAPPPITHPTDLLNLFRVASGTWGPSLENAAIFLLFTTATIDLVWTFGNLAQRDSSLHDYTTAFTRRLISIGLWYAVILHLDWMQSIVDSFIILAQRAGGASLGGPHAITASSLFADSFNISGALDAAALKAGFFTDIATGLVLHADAWIITIAYLILTLAYIAFSVQTIVSVSAGYIFTGFGGIGWLMPYAERYIVMVLSAGFRLFVLFLLVGMAHTLADTWWIPAAQNITSNTDPLLTAMEISAECVLYTVVCWAVPLIAADILSGSLTFAGEHIAQALAPPIQAGIAGATIAVNAVTGGTAAPATAVAAGASSAASGSMRMSSAGRASSSPQPAAPNGRGRP